MLGGGGDSVNRRNFIGALGAVLAASAAPSLFLPRLEPVRWKRNALVWVPNPEYVHAQFEMLFMEMPGKYDKAIFRAGTTEIYGYLHERVSRESFFGMSGHLPYPPRYRMTETGYEMVHPWIQK